MITVVFGSPDLQERAQRLAADAGCRVASPDDELSSGELALRLGNDGLSLEHEGMVVRGDFSRMLPRLRPANLQRELLVKAAKVKGAAGRPVAIDATAGLGEDALLLAAAGFSVELYERNRVIAALLADALDRAKDDPQLADIVERMHLNCEDSIQALHHAGQPDVVLLDPMFPAKGKAAAAKKKLQLLQQLEAPCEDEAALLGVALGSGARKVVVKRPVKGPHLAGAKPSHVLSGKAIRFDCYVR